MPMNFPRMPWTPQQDIDQALAYSDPVQQNRALINESRNNRTSIGMNPEWEDYYAVLKGRNAQIKGGLDNMGEGMPAGYTQNQLDTENYDYLTGGQAPRYADSQNLPSSEAHISASLRGLKKSLGIK